ncbi:MAG: tol-pal system-associated acyl-CoA thioesterase [Rhodoferax sp.]|nr:tol-pal system-associated acyl-CoA thioesterase [Rhodoferax sp.]
MTQADGTATTGSAAGGARVFHWPLRVYWEDTDAGGVVFYANYLKYFERARTEWLRTQGFGQQQLRESTGGMFVVTDATLKYHRPARLDDQLLVTTWMQEHGRVCMTIGQQARRGADGSGDMLCEATIRIGWVSAELFKPTRIPPSIVKALS